MLRAALEIVTDGASKPDEAEEAATPPGIQRLAG